jgi:hypothetical protein
MRISLANGVIQLAAGTPLALRGARNVELECTEGVVWLTLEGEPEDYLLAAGERMRIGRGGLALVEGNPAGAIRLIDASSWAVRRTSGIKRLLEFAHLRQQVPGAASSVT